MNPWGLGRTFGGEAESRFVTMNPDACQVLDDGRRVAAACLNNPRYRSFLRRVGGRRARRGCRSRLLGRAALGRPRARRSRRRDALELQVRRLSRALRARLPGRSRRRGARVPRGVARRLPRRAHRARALARRPQHRLPAPRGRGSARRAGLGRGRLASRRRRLRDRSLLEELRRGGRPVRSPLREAPRRDGEPPWRRLRALGPRVSPHGGRHPRPRGRGERRAGGGCRARVGVGLRGVRAHEPPRDSGLARGLGARVRVARRAGGANHRGRARRPRRPRPALVRRARLADERAGRDRSVGRRSCGRRDRGRGRRDRGADAARGTPDLRRCRDVRADRRGRRSRVRVDVLHACRARRRARRRRDRGLGARAGGRRGRRRRRLRASSSSSHPGRTTSSSGSARAAARRTCSEPFGPRGTRAR